MPQFGAQYNLNAADLHKTAELTPTLSLGQSTAAVSLCEWTRCGTKSAVEVKLAGII